MASPKERDRLFLLVVGVGMLVMGRDGYRKNGGGRDDGIDDMFREVALPTRWGEPSLEGGILAYGQIILARGSESCFFSSP